MRLVWVVIPLVLFSIIGISESFADERTWYVGEGLKQGDYFSYKLCHAVYNDCSEFHMDLWIEGDVQRDSETSWLTQTVVYDNNKVVKGVMHLGKAASEPTYSSHDIALYKSAFKASITELAVFSSILHPGNLTLGDYWYKNMKFIPIGQTPINVNATENEKITVPAGTYDTVVLSYSNSQDRIWIIDDFPFPIKGEAWEPGNEPKSKRYQFELLDYKENVLEDPFVPITPFEESFADLIIYDENGTEIYRFSERDLQAVTEPYSFANFLQKHNASDASDLEADISNWIDYPQKTADELERKLNGARMLLNNMTNNISVDFNETYISVMIYVDKPISIVPLPDYVQIRNDLTTIIGAKVPVGKISELESNPNVLHISSPSFAMRLDYNSTGEKKILVTDLSPKHQIKQGILPENVICKDGLELIFKSTNGSPTCVTPTTAEKLIERGWANEN